MKTVYLDENFICHLTPGQGRTPCETKYFDTACNKFIEGYRFIPDGYSWIRSDGVLFYGPMLVPVEDYNILSSYQKQYEEDCENMMSLEEVADLIEIIYEDDLGVIG